MKALLVDGLNLVRRIHSAVNPSGNDDQGAGDSVVSSCAASLSRALAFHQPSHALVIDEQHGPTWRHRLFPGYKADRSPPPADLEVLFERIREEFRALGVNVFSLTGYEADDIIATLASKISTAGGQSVILSTDRLMLQLLDRNTTQYDHFNSSWLDEEDARKRYGVVPALIPDVLALAGDSGLSIPGVPGIGIKTASRLIGEHGSLAQLLDQVDTLSGAQGEKIRDALEVLAVYHQLFRLPVDLELGLNLRDMRYPG